jgi:anti-sigma factor RsiW
MTNGTAGRAPPTDPWSGGVNDPRCLDDACYLLGALPPAEEQEYQRHLRNCPRCRTSLQHLRPVLRLLALAIPDDADRSSLAAHVPKRRELSEVGRARLSRCTVYAGP